MQDPQHSIRPGAQLPVARATLTDQRVTVAQESTAVLTNLAQNLGAGMSQCITTNLRAAAALYIL